MQRRVFCVGLRKHVEAAIDDIVPITGKRGTKYQCVGKYSENGKDYVVKSWVSKADYEALHGPVVEIEDIAAAEEFIGADVEAAEPLAADPVADSPVAEDSSEPLEVAPADKSYFLSESVVLSAIKEMAAEADWEIVDMPDESDEACQCGEALGGQVGYEWRDTILCQPCHRYRLDPSNPDYNAEDEPDPENKTFCDTCNEYVDFAECSMGKSGYAICNECSKKESVCEHCGRSYSVCLDACDEMWLPCTQEKCVCQEENCPFNSIGMDAEYSKEIREHRIRHGSNADIYCLSCDLLEGDCPCDEFIEMFPVKYDHYDIDDYLLEVEGKIIALSPEEDVEGFFDFAFFEEEISNEDLDISGWKIIKITDKNPIEWEVYDEMAPMSSYSYRTRDEEISTYDCISCGEEMDEEEGHELVGEFQEKCCLPCFKSAFGAEDECSSCKGTGTSDYYAPCELCMGNMEFDDMECRDCHGSGASDYYAPCEECSLPRTPDYTAEQTFEAMAQTKERKDQVSEQAALRLIKGTYGFKRIVSGPVYYRFVAGTSSKFLMFAVIERNNGTYQAVNVYGRRGANFPTLWASDPYSTEAQAERASKVKQQKKSRSGYVFLDAEEFRSFMAEHFNAETLNSSESIDNYMSEDFEGYCSGCDSVLNSKTHKKDTSTPSQARGFGPAFGSLCDSCFDSIDALASESPLDESPVDEDPLTAEPSDMGGPEDFSADASIDLEDGKITIHEKGVKSGSSKKLLLGVIVAAGLVAAYQNSDAVLEFFEGLKTDDDSDPVVGCMDETANNYNPDATEDDGSCTFDDDPETTL